MPLKNGQQTHHDIRARTMLRWEKRTMFLDGSDVRNKNSKTGKRRWLTTNVAQQPETFTGAAAITISGLPMT